MKIAVASSGLGHVARGIETWARDTARALHDAGVDVVLFAGSKEFLVTGSSCLVEDERVDSRKLTAETTEGQPGRGRAVCPEVVVRPCLKRTDRAAQRLARLMPPAAWRWGLKSAYGWEQLTFWMSLWPNLRRGQFGVLHVQDPMLAYWCRIFRRLGLLKTKEILAHGTEEPIAFLRKFDRVQHLAPWHLEQTLGEIEDRGRKTEDRGQRAEDRGQGAGTPPRGTILSVEHRTRNEEPRTTNHEQRTTNPPPLKPFWVAIPNFVCTDVFRPVRNEAEKRACRRRFNIPEDAFVIGTSAAVKKGHKRIDYLIREFAGYAEGVQSARVQECKVQSAKVQGARVQSSEGALKENIVGGRVVQGRPTSGLGPPPPSTLHSSTLHSAPLPFLAIAGARHTDSAELIRMADDLAPDQTRVFLDLSRDQMPDFYRCLDVFVLTSLFEMMPIAVLEAMATGLPVIANDHAVLRWMLGDSDSKTLSRDSVGGACIDMRSPGNLCGFLSCLTDPWLQEKGSQARHCAQTTFSSHVVISHYIEYYQRVAKDRS